MTTGATMVKLCIESQKDEIIARLLMQKFVLFVKLTEGWADDCLSENEINFVIKYLIEDDRVYFKDYYSEIETYPITGE